MWTGHLTWFFLLSFTAELARYTPGYSICITVLASVLVRQLCLLTTSHNQEIDLLEICLLLIFSLVCTAGSLLFQFSFVHTIGFYLQYIFWQIFLAYYCGWLRTFCNINLKRFPFCVQLDTTSQRTEINCLYIRSTTESQPSQRGLFRFCKSGPKSGRSGWTIRLSLVCALLILSLILCSCDLEMPQPQILSGGEGCLDWSCTERG